MKRLKSIKECELIDFALIGLFECMKKAPKDKFDVFTEQYSELNQRRLVIKTSKLLRVPWEAELGFIEIIITDNNITVGCDCGDYSFDSTDDAWRWVLSAISYPFNYTISVIDERVHREHIA